MRKKMLSWLFVLALTALIAACAAPATPAPAGGAAPAADTGAAAAPLAAGLDEVSRENTLIIGFEGGPSAAPEQAGLNPGAMLSQGHHQVMIESLYYLNYQDGELIPWLAAGPPEFNEDF